ncbi:MAG: hypothetical protein ACTHV2_07410 [Brachybacterium sp.]|nr:hypothetical protein [Brachybacterium sp.]MDN6329793.1 hypothetical protein [Brachybacterium sp.]
MSLGVWLREVADGLGHLLALLAPFAPYATAFAAFVAAMIALSSLSHRRRADSRAEWWRRVEYAMDLTREEGKVGRNTGMQLLTHLLDDRRWDEVDVKMLSEANEILISEVVDKLSLGPRAPEVPVDSGSLFSRLRALTIRRRS